MVRSKQQSSRLSDEHPMSMHHKDDNNNEEEGECCEVGGGKRRSSDLYEQVPPTAAQHHHHQQQQRGMTTSVNNHTHRDPAINTIMSKSDLQIFQNIMSSATNHQHHQQSEGVLQTLPRILHPPPRRVERTNNDGMTDMNMLPLRNEVRETKRDILPLMATGVCSSSKMKRSLSPSSSSLATVDCRFVPL